jgi:hypothetical protein
MQTVIQIRESKGLKDPQRRLGSSINIMLTSVKQDVFMKKKKTQPVGYDNYVKHVSSICFTFHSLKMDPALIC